ncbi:hypothetical protein B0T19DRAFT_208876 [Cercophora scortea]|uniref:Uncharacterized protein n=1 Tax=Cercophora scortea TaxID=314031 RepID=A0AAE0IEJ6_9PEZI|nr:hypothetical protein B0T19DRAFT_208876 [Cercophora scortea]
MQTRDGAHSTGWSGLGLASLTVTYRYFRVQACVKWMGSVTWSPSPPASTSPSQLGALDAVDSCVTDIPYSSPDQRESGSVAKQRTAMAKTLMLPLRELLGRIRVPQQELQMWPGGALHHIASHRAHRTCGGDMFADGVKGFKEEKATKDLHDKEIDKSSNKLESTSGAGLCVTLGFNPGQSTPLLLPPKRFAAALPGTVRYTVRYSTGHWRGTARCWRCLPDFLALRCHRHPDFGELMVDDLPMHEESSP